MVDKELLEKLQAPFPLDQLEWRVDRATKGEKNYVYVVVYIENRAIQNRLDECFGVFGWKNEYKEWKDKSQLCGISIYCEERKEWITKWDGAESGDREAIKGGLSSSMKRTAVQLGIGRYLYNLDSFRVELKAKGQIYAKARVKVNNKDEYITGYWDIPKLPEWALPKGNDKKGTGKVNVVNSVTEEETSEASEAPKDKKDFENIVHMMETSQRDEIAKLAKEKGLMTIYPKNGKPDSRKLQTYCLKELRIPLSSLTYDNANTLIEKLKEYGEMEEVEITDEERAIIQGFDKAK